MRLKLRMSNIAVLSLFLALSCTDKEKDATDPKRVLTDYIKKSFAIQNPSDKQELSIYLAGDLKTRLLSWSDEQFMEAFGKTHREYVEFRIPEFKKISDDEVTMTYELVYKEGEAKVTNRKICHMVRKDNRWYIDEVKNIKQLIEYSGEMTFP